jgi:hypothetical protein
MRMRSVVSCCVAAAALCLAAPAHADQGHSALEVEFERSSGASPSDVLALTGLILFGSAYTDSIFVAIISDRDADKRLFIPVAGPWLDLAQRDCSGCSAEWLSRALLIVNGVAQGLGVTLMIASLFVPDGPRGVGAGRLRIAPMLGRGEVGLAGAATF